MTSHEHARSPRRAAAVPDRRSGRPAELRSAVGGGLAERAGKSALEWMLVDASTERLVGSGGRWRARSRGSGLGCGPGGSRIGRGCAAEFADGQPDHELLGLSGNDAVLLVRLQGPDGAEVAEAGQASRRPSGSTSYPGPEVSTRGCRSRPSTWRAEVRVSCWPWRRTTTRRYPSGVALGRRASGETAKGVRAVYRGSS